MDSVHWTWLDLLWLVFLAGLAALPPVREIHKQLILAGMAVVQLFEASLLRWLPRRGAVTTVALKLALATLLIAHTNEVAINSKYHPIFYIPIITAAMLFGPWGTLGWTAASSAAYLSYLVPALRHYRLTADAGDQLALRIFFFFLVAMIINRFAVESRRRAASLAAANAELRRTQAEARRTERLAALGQLSAGLAHEIRNPLQVIRGSAEMLQQQTAGAGAVAVELAGYISSEVNRANLLVSRFLDFARPGTIERRPAAIAPLVDQALAEIRERWPASPVRIERDPALDLLPPVSLDATLCQRAFANLAGNALEAMDAMDGVRGGVLRVSAQVADQAGQHGINVVFADTGPGVPPELREQIFNPFFTTKPTGVGLGLAIVAKIADQHGGALRLQPAPSGGARFEMFLPFD